MKGPLQNLDSGRWAQTWLQLLQKRKMHFMNNRGIRRKLLMSPAGTKVGTKGADKIICLHFEKFPTAFGTAHVFQPRYRDCMCQMVQCARWYSVQDGTVCQMVQCCLLERPSFLAAWVTADVHAQWNLLRDHPQDATTGLNTDRSTGPRSWSQDSLTFTG